MSALSQLWSRLPARRPAHRPSQRPSLSSVEALEDRLLLSIATGTEAHLDFGSSASPVAPSYTAVPVVAYSPTRGHGWNDLTGVDNRNSAISDPLLTDYHRGTASQFKVDLAPGIYQVGLTVGSALVTADNVDLAAEGQTLETGITTQAGQFLRKTYFVSVTDGQLNLNFTDRGGVSPYFALVSLDVVPAAASAQTNPSFPTRVYASPATSTTEGSAVTFRSMSVSSGPLSYAWDFGDGTTGSGILAPTHTYKDSGIYTATLSVQDFTGLVTRESTLVSVGNVTPTASAGAPYVGRTGAAVDFRSTVSDPSPADASAGFFYLWNFGDGTTSTAAQPSHTYTAEGQYPVTLTVSDKDGGTTTATTQATITGPSASAGPDITAEEGRSITFQGAATGFGNLTYNWDYGDGSRGKGTLTPTHKYADNGTYLLTLTVKDGRGKTVTDTAVVTISNAAPTVSVGAPYAGNPGAAVAFRSTVTDRSTTDTAAGFTYLWNFGDGGASTAANPSHAYTSTGVFAVSLKVSDKDGGVTTVYTTATISGPTANAGADRTTNEGTSLLLQGTGTGAGNLSYFWSFGDGNTAAGSSSAAHTYADNGVYIATLWVQDANGYSASDSTVVTVNNVAPTASAGLSYSAPLGGGITFNSTVTDPSPADTALGFSYLWNFGDGSTSTAANPTHNYAAEGVFPVSLTVTDKDGGATTAGATATVSGTSGGGGGGDGGSGDNHTIPTVGLTPGWATFGQVLPQGQAFGSLQVGTLPTQTDVKTTWPDGSIRYAIVTANVLATGQYDITQGPEATGTFTPAIPTASARFTIDGTVYTAALPQASSSDVWLDGALVREQRFTVTPRTSGGAARNDLEVIFDLRSYRDGGNRLDVTVENTADAEGVSAVTYDVDIIANGQNVFSQDYVTQHYLTRWHEVFTLNGLTESEEMLDFDPFYAAGAIPEYLSTVENIVSSTDSDAFGLLGSGTLSQYMPAHGGRDELAPYPDWTVRYLVHQDPDQLDFVLANGDLAGSWPVHIRESNGELVSIDERPNFWLDGRAEPGNRPAGDLGATGPLTPDIAHQPSLAYVPYLITGDRYYGDEMAFWANYDLLSTWQEDYYNARGGSEGLLKENEVRGFAWALRNLSDAAAYLPDSDPTKAYFADKVDNNLEWLDNYAAAHNTPLGTSFEEKRPENDDSNLLHIALWEQNYLAWAIDHANKQGFEGGETQRDKIVNFQTSLFNSDAFPQEYGAPYLLTVGERDAEGNINYFTSLDQVFSNTYFPGGLEATQIPGYYGVDARLSLMIGIENGVAGAQQAYNWLFPRIGTDPFWGETSDLNYRAGWAIAPPSP